MAAVLAAIVVSAGAGIAIERRDPARTRRLIARMLDALLWVVTPAITFFVVARFEVTAGAGAGIAFGYVAAAAAGGAGYLVATRLLRLDAPAAGAVTVAVMTANTGYLGIPLAATLLGDDAIAPAVVYDTLVSALVLYVAGFAVGAALGARAGTSARERTRAYLTRNPVLVALLLAVLAPDALAPQPLVEIAEAAALALLPVGFFILGAHLAEIPLRASARPIAAATLVKLVVTPAVVLGCSALLVEVPDAYLLQAVMPSGINSLLVAHAFGLDLRLTAAVVAWTHVVVVTGAGVVALG